MLHDGELAQSTHVNFNDCILHYPFGHLICMHNCTYTLYYAIVSPCLEQLHILTIMFDLREPKKNIQSTHVAQLLCD